MKKFKIYVIDDDADVRSTLSNIFRFNDYDVMTFQNAAEALNYPLASQDACIILDLSMPEIDGLVLQRKLKQRGIILPIIIYSGTLSINSAVSAMTEGAFTVIQKPVDNEKLLDLVAAALKDFANKKNDSLKNKQAFVQLKALTKRERQIALLITEGLTSATIANILNISARTVEAHRAAIFNKLNVKAVGPLAQLKLRADMYSSSVENA